MGKPVDVVTVNYHSEDVLLGLVASVRELASRRPGSRMIVVDCGGLAGTEVDPEPGDGLASEVIDAGANVGFASAVNLALARTAAELVVLANPDLRLDATALDELLDTGEAGGAVAWTGVLRNDDGSIQSNTAPAPTLYRHLAEYLLSVDTRLAETAGPREVGVITGALLCGRTEALRAAGGLDERYPLYTEDVDLSVRLARRGRLMQFPIEVGTHTGGVSASRSGAATDLDVLLHAARVAWFRRRSPVEGALARGAVIAGVAARRAIGRGRPIDIRRLRRATAPRFNLRSLLPQDGGRRRDPAMCTVVILTRNEEARVASSIKAARDAGFPVLVVDSGSTDGTFDVVKASGAAWAERPFDDFASQRNWAVDQVQTPYVLFVDADELLPNELGAEVADAIAAGVDGATIPTLDYFAGRWLLHGGAFPQRHTRLLRRGAARFGRHVHERLQFDSPDPYIVDLETPLLHLSHTTLSKYIQKLDRYTEMDAAGLAQRSRAVAVARGAAEAFAVLGHRVVLRSAWRDGAHGIVAAVSYAFYRFTVHAKGATREPHDEPTLEAGMARWRHSRGR